MSFEDIPIYKHILSEVDFCFNAVPARVVCEDILSLLSRHAVVGKNPGTFAKSRPQTYASVYINIRQLLRIADCPLRGLSEVDFCFNAVPARVVCEDILSLLSRHAVVIDIASMPGGVDFDYCKEHDIPYKHSLGIPGKLSPKTSGMILADAVREAVSAHR